MLLQVLHVRQSHWAVLQLQGSEIRLYDSAYSSASMDTMETIARLVQCKKNSFSILLMNLARQIGSVDCGLYTLATLTCLATGVDPTCVVFDQDELRPHLVKVLEHGTVSAFPVKKKRRPADLVSMECKVYCHCRLNENDSGMICCDHCQEWFHFECECIT